MRPAELRRSPFCEHDKPGAAAAGRDAGEHIIVVCRGRRATGPHATADDLPAQGNTIHASALIAAAI